MKENHCTLFPDKSYKLDWQHYCKAHDKAYELQVDRREADQELAKCVYNSADGVFVIPALIIATVMFLGVRVAGKRFYNKAKLD